MALYLKYSLAKKPKRKAKLKQKLIDRLNSLIRAHASTEATEPVQIGVNSIGEALEQTAPDDAPKTSEVEPMFSDKLEESGFDEKRSVISQFESILSNALENTAQQFDLNPASSRDQAILLYALAWVHASKGLVGPPIYWTDEKIDHLRQEVQSRRLRKESVNRQWQFSENQIFREIADKKVFSGKGADALRRAYAVHVKGIDKGFRKKASKIYKNSEEG